MTLIIFKDKRYVTFLDTIYMIFLAFILVSNFVGPDTAL